LYLPSQQTKESDDKATLHKMLWLGTLFFIILGAAGVLSAPKWAKKHTGLVQIVAVTGAFCLWLSYALIYMAQLNPLLLPTRNIKKE
jgi:V-type H+-transporting ATPase subunit e